MANVSGSPSFLADSDSGLSALGSSLTFPFHPALRVIACPLRLSSQGMIIGFFGDPSNPIVEAMRMPMSMCVACKSPLDSESRMAAQFAPLATVESIPYFLNKPFSCAITMGEQSVSAIIPKRSFVVSGAPLANVLPTHPFGRPVNNAVRAAPLAVFRKKPRRLVWTAALRAAARPVRTGRPSTSKAPLSSGVLRLGEPRSGDVVKGPVLGESEVVFTI